MPAPLNGECEHWLVTSKEAARRMEDLSDLDKSLLNSVVTFEPASYTTVAGSGPGQNAWFKAQCCSCETYKNGFQKVRRPATIRVSRLSLYCRSDCTGSDATSCRNTCPNSHAHRLRWLGWQSCNSGCYVAFQNGRRTPHLSHRVHHRAMSFHLILSQPDTPCLGKVRSQAVSER